MKILLTAIIHLGIFLTLPAQQTETLYLSGTGNDDTKSWEFFCTNGHQSGAWTSIQVPSCWELQGFGTYNYGHAENNLEEKGLYKKTFFAPRSWEEKNVTIVFEGVMTDAEVRISGEPAGPVHQGAFYRFQYDISKLLTYGDSNLLEVTVSKMSSNPLVNEAERKADYWVFGGIFRPVYLTIKPENHIRRVAIDARADGSFTVDVFHTLNTNNISVSAQITDMNGTPLGNAVSAFAGKKQEKTGLHTRIDKPELWSPEAPNLYMAEISLSSKGQVIHTVYERFGFRTIELRRRDGLYLNGSRIMFKGVNRHTFWPESGRTTSKELSIKDVLLIKEMNMNAVRMSHYPPDVHFLDACDSLGLMVLDELAGWQRPPYDTETGKKLVREMITRDVNHPCIVLWDNGNEGGWNRELDGEFGKYDKQGRHVIHPWEIFDGTDTQHYKPYYYGNGTLYQGKEVFFPTEFLHGLYDGGHGAGLEDHWMLMLNNRLSAGMFLWCLVDEGVVRTDKNGWIDTDSNAAPDGILGPYREKEGSFYTVKEIWSPVYIAMEHLPLEFNGTMDLSNRYMFTSLADCGFERTLVRFNTPFISEGKYSETDTKQLSAPDILPGEKGKLLLELPADWKSYDALYLKATAPDGTEIFTWSWPLRSHEEIALSSMMNISKYPISVDESENTLEISVYNLNLKFEKQNGRLLSVIRKDTLIPLSGGPQIFSTTDITAKGMEHFRKGENYVIRQVFENELNQVSWTIRPDGWLVLDYQYQLNGEFDYAGIGFNFPEDQVTGARFLGEGPYRVWKNRLKGTRLDVWDKEYNNTVTGESWDYPEFKGYYSDPYWVWIETTGMPVLIINESEQTYLHLFTPDPPQGAYNDNNIPPFPQTDISIMHAISPIGTKFRRADEHGPQGQKNMFYPYGMNSVKSGRLYIFFGNPLK